MHPLHFSTILSRTPAGLLNYINNISSTYSGKGHTILYALSSNFTLSKDLQTVVDRLTQFNGNVPDNEAKINHGHTIGCLSDSFTSTSLEQSLICDRNEPILSCSIGIFDSSLAVPFRSTLPGREQPQVGRWHSFRKKVPELDMVSGIQQDWPPDWHNQKIGEVNWEDVWNRSSTLSPKADLLPVELRGLDPSQIQCLVSLSSPYPDILTRTLSDALSTVEPQPPAVTLIASPTHFVTGRAVTLFLDGKIYEEGAVGIAVLRENNADNILEKGKSENRTLTCNTEFIGLTRLSAPMTVTSREGNMINALDGSNPTKLLINAIETAGLSSPSNSTLGLYKESDIFALGVLNPDGKISRTYKITAGDPSSRGGSLSLDAPIAPKVGSVVQFLYKPSTQTLEIPSIFSERQSPSESIHKLAFLTVPELSSSLLPPTLTQSVPGIMILPETFLVPSFQGSVLTNGSNGSSSAHTPWLCSLPGGLVSIQWE